MLFPYVKLVIIIRNTKSFFQKGINPDDLNDVLSNLLMKGGPDQHYTFVATEDLRPYNISASYILQVIAYKILI